MRGWIYYSSKGSTRPRDKNAPTMPDGYSVNRKTFQKEAAFEMRPSGEHAVPPRMQRIKGITVKEKTSRDYK